MQFGNHGRVGRSHSLPSKEYDFEKNRDITCSGITCNPYDYLLQCKENPTLLSSFSRVYLFYFFA